MVCQCCGMPLEDAVLSREPDGTLNEEYCKWCYTGGQFTYTDPESLIAYCEAHMATETWPQEQVRAYMEQLLPTLRYWQKNNR